MLAEVGRRLLATCRAGELVARIGGEEFAWILPQVDTAGAIIAVERARAAIAQIRRRGGRRGITCSAGVCDLSVAKDVDELQRRADRALYSAKRAGPRPGARRLRRLERRRRVRCRRAGLR